jgi:hypothetical protein
MMKKKESFPADLLEAMGANQRLAMPFIMPIRSAMQSRVMMLMIQQRPRRTARRLFE